MGKPTCKICNKLIENKKELITYGANRHFLAWLIPAHKNCYEKKYNDKNILLRPIKMSQLGMIILGMTYFFIALFISFWIRPYSSYNIFFGVISIIPLSYSLFVFFRYYFAYW
jgi:hypothetical protein